MFGIELFSACEMYMIQIVIHSKTQSLLTAPIPRPPGPT